MIVLAAILSLVGVVAYLTGHREGFWLVLVAVLILLAPLVEQHTR